jgi:hypothetical protein
MSEEEQTPFEEALENWYQQSLPPTEDKKKESPKQPNTLQDFAEYLDGIRNNGSSLWDDQTIWDKDNAFQIILSKFLEQ